MIILKSKFLLFDWFNIFIYLDFLYYNKMTNISSTHILKCNFIFILCEVFINEFISFHMYMSISVTSNKCYYTEGLPGFQIGPKNG